MRNFVYLLCLLASCIFQQSSLNSAEVKPMATKSTVVIETNQGNIEISLKGDIAPKAVENFLHSRWKRVL